MNFPTTLFLCHGNVNRSAAAHAILASKVGVEVVRSAGVSPLAGKQRRMAKKMRIAVQARGEYPLVETLRSSSLRMNKEWLDWAQVIFVMDDSNIANLLKIDPWALQKNVRRLGMFIGKSKIPDPGFMRLDDPRFPEVVDMIFQSVEGYMKEWRSVV